MSGEYRGTVTCVTDNSGMCTVTSGSISKRAKSILFTVDTISHPFLTYVAFGNHDPDGGDGTTILISKP